MNTTLSLIKADVGSIGGHVTPGRKLLETVSRYVAREKDSLLTDYFVGATGDDISILMAHARGAANAEVHRLAWEAFKAGTQTAQEQGLYGGRPGPARGRL